MAPSLRPLKRRTCARPPLPVLILPPMLLFLALYRHFPPFALPSPRPEHPDTRCILYDRPPHTASTTLSEALTACLSTRNFSQTPLPYDSIPEHLIIANLVAQTPPRRSATMKHLQISARDVLALRARCPRLLYITSTRSMPDRILSSAKYVQTTGHGHSNLTRSQIIHAARTALGDLANERRLEHYPFSENLRLLPDYIVRHHAFQHDFSNLLGALRCDPAFPTLNVHRPVHRRDDSVLRRVRANITLHYADARHRRLVALAEQRNEDGLRLARTF